MPPRSLYAYLVDIEDTAVKLQQLCHGQDFDRLINDYPFRWSVERAIQNIGEAVFQIKKIDPQVAAQIDDHERIIGCRHVLVHAYFEANPAILWAIVDLHLVPLLSEIRQLRDSLEPKRPDAP